MSNIGSRPRREGPHLAANVPVRAHLDVCGWDGIAGWALLDGQDETPVMLSVFVNQAHCFDVAADRYRPDLHALGWGTGQSGFHFTLQRASFEDSVVSVEIRVAGSLELIPGTPFTLFNDEAGFAPDLVGGIGAAIGRAVVRGHAETLAAQARVLVAGLRRVCAALPGTSLGAHALAFAEPVCLPAHPMPRVTVVIAVRDQFALTLRCLRSIAAHAPETPFEVVVVDDASTDQTVLLPLLAEGVRVIVNPGNAGFLDSVCTAARSSAAPYVMLLNNDTEVHAGWLDRLVDTMDQQPEAGVVGSKLLNADGTLQECGSLVWRMGDGHNCGRGESPDRPEHCMLREADYVSGASLLVRRSVWTALGGFSPEFRPGYYEDTDLCFKARAAGWRVLVQPASVVTHLEGGTAGRDGSPGTMKAFQARNQRLFRAKWAAVLAGHPVNGAVDPALQALRRAGRRALFVDDCTPEPDADAGSNAALQHMLALQRMGWLVEFAPSENMAYLEGYTPALQRMGILCRYRPHAASVEDVLRAHPGEIGLVYLHRVKNTRFVQLVRELHPEARIVYSVADLHHLRLERGAALGVDGRGAEARGAAARVREHELHGIRGSDCTLVHSAHERDVILQALPRAPVAVVPWAVALRPEGPAFEARSGAVFIGSRHTPNIDAAVWLLDCIMPLVWQREPGFVLHLVGSHANAPAVRQAHAGLPPACRALVRLQGRVADLDEVLGAVRISVAPLRYGAGIKGKVLESLAAGVPCVMTPCAAEGIPLPAALMLVAAEPEAFAAQMLRVQRSAALHGKARRAARAFMAEAYGRATMDAALAGALHQAGVEPVRAPPL